MALFVPAVYKCRTHDRDLTEEVRRKVEAEPSRVSNLAWRWARSSKPREEPFRVHVRCPDGDGHDLVFRGGYRPR
jgi:hypothetical protein